MSYPARPSRVASVSRFVRQNSLSALALIATGLGALQVSACGDDDDVVDGFSGTGGTAAAGEGGSGGSGLAGSGVGGKGGAGDDEGSQALATGSIEVLSDDAMRLLGPTTVALRGETLWFANGQLSGLFGGVTPALPFTARSLPLVGGPLGDAEIELAGSTFYPEGIAAASDGTLYIGSVGSSTIVRVPADSTTAETFLSDSVPERSVIGLKVDDTRELLWFCDSDPLDSPGAAAVVGVSLDDGSEVVRHDLTAESAESLFCNDILVDPVGNIWATESQVGIIFRIAADDALTANSAIAWLRGGEAAPPPDGFGANGIAVVDGRLVVSNVGSGTLFTVDPESQDPAANVRRIVLSEEGRDGDITLCGPDGLLGVPGSDGGLIVVENGGCSPAAPRIIRITLDI